MRKDLIALSDDSKVWVYQADKTVDDDTEQRIKEDLHDFSMNWLSHGTPVDCYVNLFHKRFLVFVADDTNHVSGCSIDSSVHFIKALEQKYGLNFFDRLTFAYVEDDEFRFIHNSNLNPAYKSGQITDDTRMVNNLVKSKEEFLRSWIIPLKESWYKKLIR
ncbi:MAG: hypothetical protein KJO29_00785 [Bacteroidia bacterium]|nr:hypothetical protein [Bacteroidia bacterium]